jgi:hypothetical protein
MEDETLSHVSLLEEDSSDSGSELLYGTAQKPCFLVTENILAIPEEGILFSAP